MGEKEEKGREGRRRNEGRRERGKGRRGGGGNRKRVEEERNGLKRKETWYLLCLSLPSKRAEARAGLTSWAVPGEMGICP